VSYWVEPADLCDCCLRAAVRLLPTAGGGVLSSSEIVDWNDVGQEHPV
jgi:hypothetical protein